MRALLGAQLLGLLSQCAKLLEVARHHALERCIPLDPLIEAFGFEKEPQGAAGGELVQGSHSPLELCLALIMLASQKVITPFEILGLGLRRTCIRLDSLMGPAAGENSCR